MKKIAIIGAGISGLYIANLFKDHKDSQVTIVWKFIWTFSEPFQARSEPFQTASRHFQEVLGTAGNSFKPL